MKEFFFDTANINFINETWDAIKSKVDKKLVAGITTNPNAFFKINKTKLSEWFDLMPQLCNIVSNIRNDNKGVVYIQCPNSNMSHADVMDYAKLVSTLTDGKTKVGLKIPPYTEILEWVPFLNEYVETNVTGVSDCCTALKCLTYPVNYVSVIPGRMEEVGINAQSQVAFIAQSYNYKKRVITGSMRTIECLTWTFLLGTVPTIGERVWPLILQNDTLDRLISLEYPNSIEDLKYSPPIDERSFNLSKSFFEQMDKCGQQAYLDLKLK